VHLTHGELGVGDAYGSLGIGFRLLQLVLQLVWRGRTCRG
jgi:hypothetical protein